MQRSRIVRPETVTLPISDGDHLVVKKRLTAGERRRRLARMYVHNGNGDTHVDPLQVGLATILAYLVDWSLVDLEGKPLGLADRDEAAVVAILDAIDVESYREIQAAIEAHEAAELEARTAEKKILTGAPAS